jgi:flavin reductase (DIM6/NTAB) family NADH-FMN oxidoreductase RutF
MRNFTGADIAAMEERHRVFFVNALSGFKSANLVGTISADGHLNLAMISSVMHLGSNPPLLALLSRPHTVRRDTLENIHATGYFTVNHVRQEFLMAAHQSAARYEATQSEFEMVGLAPAHGQAHPAPYVADSVLQIGLAHRQTVDLEINGCHLVIGEIVEVRIDERLLAEDGSVDLGMAGSLVVGGPDHYHATQAIARLGYAKADRAPRILADARAPSPGHPHSC